MVHHVIEAQIWTVLALFGGAMFAMAFITSLPRDSRGAVVARCVLHGALALGLAWYVGKDLMA